MSAIRIRALLLAVTMLAVPATLLQAEEATAQTQGVPVDFEPSKLRSADLHLWKEGGDDQCNADGIAGQGESNAECNLRIDQIPSSDTTSSSETRSVADNLGSIEEAHRARFVLDTDPDTDAPENAQFPFNIVAGGQAVQYSFWYDSDSVCEMVAGEPTGQPIGFRMRLLSGASEGSAQPLQATNVTEEACGTAGGQMTASDANRVDVTVDLDEGYTITPSDVLILEIAAYDPDNGPGPTSWSLFYESASRDSKVVLRTDGVVHKAVWATDAAGDHRRTFNPNAPADERYLVGRMALKSPFGEGAVPSKGFVGEIEGPSGTLVDLDPEASGRQTSVDLAVISGLTTNNRSLKVYSFDELSDDQVWHYPDDADTGPQKIRMTGRILGQRIQPETSVAMGAFNFELAPVTGETTSHDLLKDSSTTFLLRLVNGAPDPDTFELSANFEFSEPTGSPWSVDLAGVDQNNRITLDAAGEPGDRAIIQVKVTPPDDVNVGHAARVNVTAVSSASETRKAVQLQGTVTDQTVRDVGILALQSEPFKIGVDDDKRVRVFAWNQGTATDTLRVDFVTGSFSNADKLNASLVQRRFANIDPGAVATVPIDLTTTEQAEEGQTLGFQVQASSVSTPEEVSDPFTVEAFIEAERGFQLLALDGENPTSLSSTRYAKFNQSEAGPGSPECESTDGADASYIRNCRDYTNWTYHRFTLENTGDVEETFLLSAPSNTRVFDHPGDPGDCTQVFPRRSSAAETYLVDDLDPDAPGTESKLDELTLDAGQEEEIFLRVHVNGSLPYYQSVGPSEVGACAWETLHTSVKASIDGTAITKVVDTETKAFVSLHPEDDGFDDAAEARMALLDRAMVNGTFSEIPDFTGVEPGTGEAIHFTLSQQAGHHDPVRVTVGPETTVENLRADGWRVELISTAYDATKIDDGNGLLIPDRGSVGQEEEIAHATGLHIPVRLMVRAPETGIQEDVRHTLNIEAESSFRPDIEDSLGIGIQIGKDFAFDVDAGTQTLDATPGDTVGFGLTVQNTGASRDTFDVSATISPDSFDEPTLRPGKVTVSSGSQKAVAIEVPVPAGAQPGTTATVSVQVTANHGTATTEDDSPPVTREYTIEVQEDGTLSLEPAERTVRVGPGGQNALNFTISNSENSERTVELVEEIAPAGWETTLSGDATARKTVPAQGEATFQYLIEAPETIVEDSVFSFVVRAQDVQDNSNFAASVGHATTLGETEIQLDPESNREVVDRGDNVTFPVLVRNPGTSPTWYDLSTEFDSSGWSGRILEADGSQIQNASVRVPEKQFKRVLVDVNAPSQVTTGHVETVTLTAAAEGQSSISDTIQLDAAIHDYAAQIEVTGALAKDAVPGDDVAYTVSITNNGNGEDAISLSFEDGEGEDPVWPVSTELSDETTPVLEPGETLTDVTVEVHVPGPGEGPVPVPEGIATLIRATSSGQSPEGGSPTATTEVTTRLVKYVPYDVDGDGALELGVDLNRDASDGFEVFADRDATLIDRGVLSSSDSRASEGLYTLDGDDDDRVEHVVDVDGDGVGDRYFDPGRARSYEIPYTFDADGDGQPDHPIDSDFDGEIDRVYDPGDDAVHKAVHLDFSGDGRLDVLIDMNDDTFFDTFVDPHASPPVVSNAERDGDLYKLDTDGNGEVDTHYNVETQTIEDARVGNLSSFLGDYWWFLLVFLLVVGLFGVIVYRRL